MAEIQAQAQEEVRDSGPHTPAPGGIVPVSQRQQKQGDAQEEILVTRFDKLIDKQGGGKQQIRQILRIEGTEKIPGRQREKNKVKTVKQLRRGFQGKQMRQKKNERVRALVGNQFPVRNEISIEAVTVVVVVEQNMNPE